MAEELIERVIQRAIDIQQIPAPTFSEIERAEYIYKAFLEEGLTRVEIDSIGNVFGCLPGAASQTSLVVSAHTDTVFPAETNLRVKKHPQRIYGPGIGDNSLGVAGLFALLWELQNQNIELPGDLWLVANVGEEGLGDLTGMKKVVERFGDSPMGYVVLEGLAFGRIYHCGLGVRRYRIEVETDGGHSWVDYGAPSAIHELSMIMSQILSIRLPTRKRTTVNIGKISGGISVNTIAPYACLELDLRSENENVLASLSRKIEDLVRFSERPGVHFTCAVIGDRPFGGIPEGHPLVQLGIKALVSQDSKADLLTGSTDANVPLSKGIPAICIGLANGGGAHTEEEYLDTDLLPRGIAQLVEVVVKSFEILD